MDRYGYSYWVNVYGTMTQVIDEVGYGSLSQDMKRDSNIATSSMSDILDSYYDYRSTQSWN